MSNDVVCVHSSLLQQISGITHGFSTRHGGVSEAPWATLNISLTSGDVRERVEENRQRILQSLGRPDATWISLKQEHGAEIVEVTARAGRSIPGDGLLTRDKDACVAVLGADCVPILFADVKHRVVAGVHAGWRGTRANIAGRMIARLNELDVKPADIRVALGPGIGPCCFEIGQDVAEALRAAYPRCEAGLWPAAHVVLRDDTGEGNSTADQSISAGVGVSEKWMADLWALNRHALMEAGVAPEHIDTVSMCTVCSPDFYSYRREQGSTGRHAGVITFAR